MLVPSNLTSEKLTPSKSCVKKTLVYFFKKTIFEEYHQLKRRSFLVIDILALNKISPSYSSRPGNGCEYNVCMTCNEWIWRVHRINESYARESPCIIFSLIQRQFLVPGARDHHSSLSFSVFSFFFFFFVVQETPEKQGGSL